MSLYYANKIGSEYNGKTFTYKDYKRKLSHIESAFPTWMMGIKSKHDRVYVLDNKLSQQIWDIEPLKTIRKEHDIYFIEVADLNNYQGLRLDVHKKGNCINLTEAPELPAMNLAPSCYANMFQQSKVCTMPELPALVLFDSCYRSMFQNPSDGM